MQMSDLTRTLIDTVAWLARLIADLVGGAKTEDEARKECQERGIRITETDSDAELGEYERLLDDAASDR